MSNSSKNQWLVLALILSIAGFFRFHGLRTIPPGLWPDEASEGNDAVSTIERHSLQVFYPDNNGREGLYVWLVAVSVKLFGIHPWSIRAVSAVFGLMTVLGLYFLARSVFNWRIAATSSFLLAVSFWHTNFSRIGFRGILAPFFAVWGFYFLYKGLLSLNVQDYALAGIFWGLGFYTYIAFRAMPLALVIVLLVYLLQADSGTRNKIMRRLALFLAITVLVVLPLGYHFYVHPNDFVTRASQVSLLSEAHPWPVLMDNIVKTLSMFTFAGDENWRHNISGAPLLPLIAGIFFVIGLIVTIVNLVNMREGHWHFSTPDALVLSLFFVALIPVISSNEGVPHALRAIIAAPAVYVLAAEGLWWFANRFAGKFSAIVVIVLLFATMLVEYHRYFHTWGDNPILADAFNQDYVNVANALLLLPPDTPKYVVVYAGGAAQTVTFLTDTNTREKQQAKNIRYVTPEQFRATRLPAHAALFYLYQ